MVYQKLSFHSLQGEKEPGSLYRKIADVGNNCFKSGLSHGDRIEVYDLGRTTITLSVSRPSDRLGCVILESGIICGSEHTDVNNTVKQLGLEKYVVGGSK